jgi:hypothetical protein
VHSRAGAPAADLRAQLKRRSAAAADLRAQRGAGRAADLRCKLSSQPALASAAHRAAAPSATTLPELLHALGLQQYLPAFEAEEVDLAALAQCSEADLQALGLPMGPRKKLLAMLPR